MANGMPVVLGQSNSATNVTTVDCSTTAEPSLSVQKFAGTALAAGPTARLARVAARRKRARK